MDDDSGKMKLSVTNEEISKDTCEKAPKLLPTFKPGEKVKIPQCIMWSPMDEEIFRPAHQRKASANTNVPTESEPEIKKGFRAPPNSPLIQGAGRVWKLDEMDFEIDFESSDNNVPSVNNVSSLANKVTITDDDKTKNVKIKSIEKSMFPVVQIDQEDGSLISWKKHVPQKEVLADTPNIKPSTISPATTEDDSGPDLAASAREDLKIVLEIGSNEEVSKIHSIKNTDSNTECVVNSANMETVPEVDEPAAAVAKSIVDSILYEVVNIGKDNKAGAKMDAEDI